MSSEYQMWLTHNGGSEKLRFPVLPDIITVTNGSMNKSVDIAGLGEIVIKQDRPALGISFSSIFPSTSFPGIQVSSIVSPKTLKQKVMRWKDSEKPSHFLITGTDINMHCTIEDFPFSEQGGDIGTIYYTLKMKEYRSVSARQIKVNTATQKAVLAAVAPARVDNRVQPKTYTVSKGDCLWNIAAKLLGSGSRYTEIASLNSDIIKSPNLILPGQVLRLPTA